MGIVKIEQRKEQRISQRDLPDKYQGFTVVLEDGSSTEVKCVDISKNGLSFISKLSPEAFVTGTQIHLSVSGIEEPLFGIIVSSGSKENTYRRGVSLKSLGGFEQYQSVFTVLYNKLKIE